MNEQAYFLAGAFIFMYASWMWHFMDCYQDDYYLAEWACLNSPDSWYAWHIRGMQRWNNGSYKEAITLWTMAKLINPLEAKVLFNIATVLRVCNFKAEALEYMKEVEKNIPKGQEAQLTALIKEWRSGKMPILT